VRKIEIKVLDKVFVATLMEKEAPRTCKKFLDILPMESHSIFHSIWSGHMINVMIKPLKKYNSSLLDFKQENLTTCPSVGDVVIGTAHGPVEYAPDADISKGFSELFIVYHYATLRCPWGPMPCNHFARIDPQQFDDIREIGLKLYYNVADVARKGVVIREKKP